MSAEYSFCIFFSGIKVRFIAPTNLTLPECITELLCEDCDEVDAEYKITLLHTPLHPEGTPVYTDGDSQIYFTEKGRLRIYSPLTDENGCQVACLLCSNGKNTLFYPAAKWERYRKYWHSAHLLWGEMLLMHLDSFLLHSSVVLAQNKAVLFCGASGVGKSTQAKLWQKHKGAQIINGDRCVITKKDNTFYGGGSLWSGTSGIYNPTQAPLAGIFILKQGKENSARLLKAEAFSALFSNITLNPWDTEFMEKVTTILSDMLNTVRVWELTCLPEKSAADYAYEIIFSKEFTL